MSEETEEKLQKETMDLALRMLELTQPARSHIKAVCKAQHLPKDSAEILMKVAEEEASELHEKLARVIADHCAKEELKVMVEFYESELGRSFLEHYHEAAGDMFRVTANWSLEIALTANKKIREQRLKKQVEEGIDWSKYL